MSACDYQAWQAAPYRDVYGQARQGKVHLLNPENPSKTLCGKEPKVIGGRPVFTESTCKVCSSIPEKRQVQDQRRAQAQAEWAERQRERQEQNAEWWRWYNGYLQTPAWRALREKVMRRANGRCEGCGECKAVQVHHLTYAHVGEEFLWELRAVCTECHERLHQDRRDAAA
jgi:5-methylcytosine-specific restriction endonuclease McrA